MPRDPQTVAAQRRIHRWMLEQRYRELREELERGAAEKPVVQDRSAE